MYILSSKKLSLGLIYIYAYIQTSNNLYQKVNFTEHYDYLIDTGVGLTYDKTGLICIIPRAALLSKFSKIYNSKRQNIL